MMDILIWILLGLLLLWNVVTYAMYAVDKSRAKSGKWRIKEKTLILVAFFMGGFGAFLGMKILRHKTQHIQFKILVPLGIVVNIGVLAAVWFVVIR